MQRQPELQTACLQSTPQARQLRTSETELASKFFKWELTYGEGPQALYYR